jgi:hypothetical protein
LNETQDIKIIESLMTPYLLLLSGVKG